MVESCIRKMIRKGQDKIVDHFVKGVFHEMFPIKVESCSFASNLPQDLLKLLTLTNRQFSSKVQSCLEITRSFFRNANLTPFLALSSTHLTI